MRFEEVLPHLREGARIARSGWNGRDMFVFLVPGSTFQVNRPPLLGIYPEGTTINYHAHVDMKTANGTVVPWLCSQTDLLADDWFIYADGFVDEDTDVESDSEESESEPNYSDFDEVTNERG